MATVDDLTERFVTVCLLVQIKTVYLVKTLGIVGFSDYNLFKRIWTKLEQ